MHKKALTLIEMLIVIAILSFLMGSIYLILFKGKDIVEFLNTQAELTHNARTAMQETLRDLYESDRETVTKDINGLIPSFIDPLNNETHQILIFASARGNPTVGAEDGIHLNNDYVHLDSNYKPMWRSAIIYCTYVTADGTQQLRKYIDYNSQTDIFPLSLISVTSSTINLRRSDGTFLSIPRDSGTVRANYIATEDANNSGLLDADEDDGNVRLPADNKDNVLDRGADFTLNGGVLKIKLFLAKSETLLAKGKRFSTVTLSGSTELRNK